jgi:hypothetical protein
MRKKDIKNAGGGQKRQKNAWRESIQVASRYQTGIRIGTEGVSPGRKETTCLPEMEV